MIYGSATSIHARQSPDLRVRGLTGTIEISIIRTGWETGKKVAYRSDCRVLISVAPILPSGDNCLVSRAGEETTTIANPAAHPGVN